MTKTFTDITHPNFRCSIGGCPGIHKSKDGKTFVIIGTYRADERASITEAAVEISADLVLASLGVNDLVEAAEPIAEYAENQEPMTGRGCQIIAIPLSEIRALRSVLNKIKGGA